MMVGEWIVVGALIGGAAWVVVLLTVA